MKQKTITKIRPPIIAVLALSLFSLANCASEQQKQEKSLPPPQPYSATPTTNQTKIGQPSSAAGTANIEVNRTQTIPAIRTVKISGDINRMGAEHFEAIGFTTDQANNIVKYRNEHGAFKSVDELANVPGIDPVAFALEKNKLAVNKTPA